MQAAVVQRLQQSFLLQDQERASARWDQVWTREGEMTVGQQNPFPPYNTDFLTDLVRPSSYMLYKQMLLGDKT